MLFVIENVAVDAYGDDGIGSVGLLDLYECIQMFIEALPVFRVKAGVEDFHILSLLYSGYVKFVELAILVQSKTVIVHEVDVAFEGRGKYCWIYSVCIEKGVG